MNPRRPVRTVDRHASENHSHTAHDSPPPPQHMTDPQGGSGTANRVVGNADTGSNGACANFFTGFNFRAGFIRSGGPRLAIGNLDSAATALPAAIWGSGRDFKIDFATLPGGAPRFPPPVAPMLPRFRWACTKDLTPHGMSSMMIPSIVWELRGAVARDAAALAARYVRRRRAERYLGVAHAGSPDRERGRRPISPPPPRPPPSSHPSTPSPPPVLPPPRPAAVSSPQTPTAVAPSGVHLRLRSDPLPLSMMEPISRVLFPTDDLATSPVQATPGLLDPALGLAERRALLAALRAWYVWELSTSPNVLKRRLLWWNRRIMTGGWLAWSFRQPDVHGQDGGAGGCSARAGAQPYHTERCSGLRGHPRW